MRSGKTARMALSFALALTLIAGMIPSDIFTVQAWADDQEDILILDGDTPDSAESEADILDDVVPADNGSEAYTADESAPVFTTAEDIPDIDMSAEPDIEDVDVNIPQNDMLENMSGSVPSFTRASGTDGENTLIIRYAGSEGEAEAPSYEDMVASVRGSMNPARAGYADMDDNIGAADMNGTLALEEPDSIARNGSPSGSWEGTGISTDPYKITTAAELKALADDVNIGYSYENTHFKLVDDIDLSTVCGDDINGVSVSWVPIGEHSGVSFGGSFDGNGKKITNLFIDESLDSYRGLFGNLTGTIQNLTVTGSVTGKDYVGGIVGCSYGELTNCRFVDVSDTVKSSVTGHDNVGGIAGYSGYGRTVNNCVCDADINGNGSSIGGIIGWANNILEHKSRRDAENPGGATAGTGSIQNCTFSGSLRGRMPNRQDPEFRYENGKIIVSYIDNAYGGVVGWSNGYYIYNCKNTGTVDGDDFTGGIAGDATNGSQFVKCKNSGTVTSERGFLAGGVVARLGKSYLANPVGPGFDPDNRNENEGAVTAGSFTGGIVGFADKDSSLANCTNYNPAVTDCEFNEFVGGVVGISNCEIYDCINNGSVSGKDYVGGVAGYSTCDIEKCHSQADSVVTGSEMGGMQKAGTGGVAGRLLGSINDCTNAGKVTGNGSSPTGGVAGYVRYYVTNCKNLSTAIVVGGDYVGGVVGRNGADNYTQGSGHGRVSNCINEGMVTASSGYAAGVVGYALEDISDCTNDTSASVTGHFENVGGVVGIVGGEVKNCTNRGTVTNTDNYSKYTGGVAGTINSKKPVDNCSNTGTVTGKDYTGGIVGLTSTVLKNNDNAGTVSGSDYTGGIAGGTNGNIAGCNNKNGAQVSGVNYVGGITGASSGTVSKCKNAGAVTGTDSFTGGVSGLATDAVTGCINEASGVVTGDTFTGGVTGGVINKQNETNKISNCTNSGKVIGRTVTGGITGFNEGTLEDCFNNTGSSVKSNSQQTGGIAGANVSSIKGSNNLGTVEGDDISGGIAGSNTGSIEKCINDVGGAVTGKEETGGITGYNEAGTIKECQNRENVTGNGDYKGGIAGYIKGGTIENCDNFAALSGDNASSGTANLGGIAGICTNGGKISECTNHVNITGPGKVVGGIVGDCVGETCTVEKCTNIGKITAGADMTGGIAGTISSGTVSECKNTGVIDGSNKDYIGGITGVSMGKVSKCLNEGAVSGASRSGGIVGTNGGTIEDSKNIAAINGSDEDIGGIAGYNGKTLTNCTNSGTVTGTTNYVGGIAGTVGGGSDTGTIERCANSGAVNAAGKEYIGGIAGSLLKGKIKDCSNSGGVTGYQYIGGISGQTEATVEKCSNSGNIVSSATTASEAKYAGGVSGSLSSSGSVTESINNGSVSGYEGIGGIAGISFGSVSKSGNESNGTVSGTRRVGGVVGDHEGSKRKPLTECYNKGRVGTGTNVGALIGGICGFQKNSAVESCYNTGEIKGNEQIGGISGQADASEISKCRNTATISVGKNDNEYSRAGGILGVAGGSGCTIDQCSNRGAVTGEGYMVAGIAGRDGTTSVGLTMQDCYNTGTIKGKSFVAGIAGYIKEGSRLIRCHNWTAENPNTVPVTSDAKLACSSGTGAFGLGEDRTDCLEDCYYSNVNGLNYDAVSWDTAENIAGRFTHLTEGNMSDSSKFTNWNFGTVWMISNDSPFHGGQNGPILRFESNLSSISPSGPTVTPDPGSPTIPDPVSPDPTTVLISSVDELKAFRDKVNNGTSYENATVKLGTDLDLTGETWIPIGDATNKFDGTFDGAGHSIYNLSFNSNKKYVGLFGYISNKAKICNLEVSGAVANTYNSAECYIGGIVGYNEGGTVEYCAYFGTVSGTGQSTNYSYTGGIAGCSSGTVKYCCFIGGVISTQGYGGGIIGRITSGAVKDCYRYYSPNKVDVHTENTDGKSGNIVGYADGGSSTNCYYYTNNNGYYGAGSLEIHAINNSNINSTDFNKQSKFEGWDFTDVWAMGEQYPLLRVLSYQVTLNKNNGTSETKSYCMRKLNARLPLNTFESGNILDSFDHYVAGRYDFFKNWNTKTDGSGTVYEDRASISSDLTLYAQWKAVDRYYDIYKVCYAGYDRTNFGGLFDNKGGQLDFAHIDPYSSKNIVEFNTLDYVRPSGIVFITSEHGSPAKVVLEAKKHSSDPWIKILETDEIMFPKENNKGVLLQLENNPEEYCFYQVTIDKDTYFNEVFLVVDNLSTDVRQPRITLDPNGGHLATGNTATYQDADNQRTATLIDNPYEREGFVFAGWNTKADGSGTTYEDKAAYPVDGDSTLYAQWTPQTYTITFVDEDGSTLLDTQSLLAGTVPVYQGATELKKAPSGGVEYVFSGWTPAITAVTGDKTYTATYAEVNKIFNVTVTDDGHGTGSANPASGISGTWVTLSATPDTDYHFKEWQLVSGNAAISNNKFKIMNTDVKVKAVFEHDYVPTPPTPPEHIHEYVESITKEPTCTEKGEKTFTCSCGYSYTEEIPKLGHLWVGYVSKAPAGDKEGVLKRFCTRCEEEEDEPIAALEEAPEKATLTLFEKRNGNLEVCHEKAMTVGKKCKLIYKLSLDTAKDPRTVWFSSNPNVAAVNQDGKVTALCAGETVITALCETYPDNVEECLVTVTEPVTKITLDGGKRDMGTGEYTMVTAKVIPHTATQQLTWITGNPNVVIVCDEAGRELTGKIKDGKKRYKATDKQMVMIKAVGAGNTSIYAMAADGTGKKAGIGVHVGNPVPEFSLTCTEKQLTGEQRTAFGTAVPGDDIPMWALAADKSMTLTPKWNGAVPKNTGLNWSLEPVSGSVNAASVSDKGAVTGLKEGVVKVTATAKSNSGRSASAYVYVYMPVKNVKLNAASGVLSMADGANAFVLSTKIDTLTEGEAATGEKPFSEAEVKYRLAPEYSDAGSRNYEKTKKYAEYIKITQESGSTACAVSLDRDKMCADGVESLKGIKIQAVVTGYDGYGKILTCTVKTGGSNVLKNIRLSSKSLIMGQGDRAALTVTFDPVNPDGDTSVNWESLNEDIVKVDKSGNLTALKPGRATIKATANATVSKLGKDLHPEAVCTVMVKSSVTGMTFGNADELKDKGLAVGKTIKLKPVFTFSDGRGQGASRVIKWTSSDEAVATVSPNGDVKAITPGRVTITATSADDKAEGEPAKVSVTFDVYAAASGLVSDKSRLALGTAAGAEYGKISVTEILPVNVTDPSILWTAGNDNIALGAVAKGQALKDAVYELNTMVTVRGEALAIRALKPGVTKLTGVTRDGTGRKVNCTVTVRGMVTGMTLKESPADRNGLNGVVLSDDTETPAIEYTSTMKQGGSMTLKPVQEINGVSGVSVEKSEKKKYKLYRKYTDTSVTYRSSNTRVAAVDGKGKISINKNAASGDTAVIYIASADRAHRIKVTVTVK